MEIEELFEEFYGAEENGESDVCVIIVAAIIVRVAVEEIIESVEV